MEANHYDLLVIGGGAAGISAGKVAGSLGFRVAIVERNRLGGECTWTGCVPSKALLAAAHAYHEARATERFGLPRFHPDGPVDLGRVLARIHEVQHHVYDADDSPQALARYGCGTISGPARFVGPSAIEVDGRRLTAHRFVLATGGTPALPPVRRLEAARPLTNEDVFALQRLPARLAVLGGGPTGVELAQAFRRLGSEVTLFERDDHLLSGHDPELAGVLAAALRAEGVDVRLGESIEQVERSEAGVAVTSSRATDTFDEILVSAGRQPRTEGLGLEAAGVELTEAGTVRVDGRLRTSNPCIYACGDLIGAPQATNAAGLEASVAVRNALLPWHSTLDHRLTVSAVYTDPEVASVGLGEAEARRRHRSVRVYREPFAQNDRARAERRTEGFLKLVCTGWRDRVVGAHVVGLHAADLANEVALGMAKGITASTLARAVHAYPTRGEAMRDAAQGALLRWGRHRWLRAAAGAYIWAARRLDR